MTNDPSRPPDAEDTYHVTVLAHANEVFEVRADSPDRANELAEHLMRAKYPAAVAVEAINQFLAEPDPAADPDRYPYSAVIVDTAGVDRRLCPVCGQRVPAADYADHWRAAHPAEVEHLATIEADPLAVDRWADDGFPTN